MVEITCPHCGEVYHADAIHIGKRIKCAKCGSILPIIDTGGTLVETPPEASKVRPSQRRAETRSAPLNLRSPVFALGSIVVAVAVVIAVGLVVVPWRSSPNEDAPSVPPSAKAVSRTPSETGATPAPPVNSDSVPAVNHQPVTTGSDVPCDEQGLRTSMTNGSRIVPDVGTNGYGILEVQNGTKEDAVMSLYDTATNETIREVYVQARHSIRIKGILEGRYQLVYTAGLDWDDSEAIFRCDPDYAQFERDFVFTEKRDREGIQYHSITVTLHPVVGGNIRTKKISRQEFLKNHRRTVSVSR